MQLNVKLFATLRDGRFKEEMTEIKDKGQVIDVIEKYNLPIEEVHICLVNGRDVDKEHVLQNGDTVSLFPPVGGG